jgi:hypothetical protein
MLAVVAAAAMGAGGFAEAVLAETRHTRRHQNNDPVSKCQQRLERKVCTPFDFHIVECTCGITVNAISRVRENR